MVHVVPGQTYPGSLSKGSSHGFVRHQMKACGPRLKWLQAGPASKEHRMIAAKTRKAAHEQTPVEDFSECHAGILAALRTFTTLPPLHDAARRARKVALDTLAMMDKAVLEHHREEEE